jgi:hypothetical protein
MTWLCFVFVQSVFVFVWVDPTLTMGVAFDAQTTFANGLNNIRPVFRRCGLEPHKWTSGSIHRALGLDLGKDHVHNALFDVRSLRATLAELHRRNDAKCGV